MRLLNIKKTKVIRGNKMTHNENRQSWFKEGSIGLGVGILYGTTNVLAGHPFDTIKTKMQAQVGFENQGMLKSFAKTVRGEGIRGLYRGCVPPLWGSGIYRSTQFAVFESVYTYCNNYGQTQIPLTGGLQIRVVIGGLAASTARAIIETPLEVAKIKRQTCQTWYFRELYKGFSVTWCRTIGLMTTYFILIDTMRRHLSEYFKRPLLGPFLISGVAATTAWWIVWPLENMKTQIQSNYGKNVPLLTRMQMAYVDRGGMPGLYRGIVPGSIRSFLANGCAMIVMSYAQRKVTELGWRK
ncbi:mitochondrial substrate carrier family protein S-like isoform X2 [Hydractinia symbiolongicarpus]|uniref:mitochondrial substrate carrier family protein S-like isoform X2 n=1 Tax=Hydractinia symbiolongicarpus TaxID=13093 RepID=UPI00254BFB7E|nr:mitochondrial substrate carrier family protein S-like isoform X2 [Hydractinia symbiolongicarpus]